MRLSKFAGSLAVLGCLSLPALAEDCGPLKLITNVQLVTFPGSYQEMVPVTVNGAAKLMLLDTGGYITQVTADTAKELKMEQHDSALHLFDVSGHEFRTYALADSFKLGSLMAEHQPMMVTSVGAGDVDGIVAPDLMLHYDIDIDFGMGRLRYFSPDHCPGKVVYWSPPAVAAVPITVDDRQIFIPVSLDGKNFKALVDTGATRTTISTETAKRLFDLDPQSSDLQKGGVVNGDKKLASFTHVFHTLSFDGIDVSNPRLNIMPDRVNSGSREQQTGNRALLGDSDLKLPELTLGMDVLRHLHVYMAFKEKRFYVSAGSEPRKPGEMLASLDEAVAASPGNPGLLNSRCFVRGLQKVHLDEALQDCDLALKAKPQDARIIDSRAFVLFQQGHYREALETYNQALAIDSSEASSLFMRGHAKRKLGDAAGGDADIATAKALNDNIQAEFKDAGLATN